MGKRIAVLGACLVALTSVVASPVASGAAPVAEPKEQVPLADFATFCFKSEETNYYCYLLTQALLEKEAEIDWEAGGYPGDSGALGDEGSPGADGATIQSIDILPGFGGEVPGTLLFGIEPDTQYPNNVYGLMFAELRYNWLWGYSLDTYSIAAHCGPPGSGDPITCIWSLLRWALLGAPNPLELEYATIGAGYGAADWASYGGTTERWQLGAGYDYGNEGVWEEANYNGSMHVLGLWCAVPTIHNPLGYEVSPCGHSTTVWEETEDSHPNSPARDYVQFEAWLNNNGISATFGVPGPFGILPLDLLGGVDIVPR